MLGMAGTQAGMRHIVRLGARLLEFLKTTVGSLDSSVAFLPQYALYAYIRTAVNLPHCAISGVWHCGLIGQFVGVLPTRVTMLPQDPRLLATT